MNTDIINNGKDLPKKKRPLRKNEEDAKLIPKPASNNNPEISRRTKPTAAG
ncbi:MAG: hypothetical protein AMXMBFR84_45450 [Candidatus Hydrogenedentota bacterium]